MKRMFLLAASLLMLPMLSHADTEPRNPDGVHGLESVGSAPSAQQRDRLRFRDGPLTTCAQGMSEEDIRRAGQERRERTSPGSSVRIVSQSHHASETNNQN